MNDYPLIKFTLLFICGIILEYYLAITGVVLGALLIVLLLVGTVGLYRYNKNVFWPSVSIFLSVIVFGSIWYSSSISNIKKYPFLDPKIKNVRVYGKVTKIDLIKEKRLTFNLSPDSILIGNKKNSYTTTFLCNLYDEDNLIRKMYDVIKIGNRVVYDCMLSRPRNERNPYEFDYEKYLNDRGVTALATAYSIESLEIENTDYNKLKNSIFEIRKYIDERITLVHNKTTQGMLRGLILADRSGIDYQTNSDFMNAGVVHVLSVSGLHVGYIVIIFLFLFNRFNLYWRVSLTVVGLIIYMIITGSEAPVFRSTVMASVILITPFFGRESNSYNTLSLAALIILLIDPKELFNPSFQLSFSAILSLIILYPVLSQFIKAKNFKSKVANYLLLFFGSTLIAQIGTLPFTLVYFGKISVTSLFANLFVIPISGVIVGLGIVAVVFSTFSFWLAEVFAICNELLTYLMLYLVQVFGNPSYSFINITQFSLYDSILFYLTFGLIFSQWTRFNRIFTKSLFVSLSFAVFIVLISFDNSESLSNNKLSVLAIDVGQGDSFLIKFPNGQTALVDAGEATPKFDNGKRVIIPLLNKLGIKKIDYLFISHIDSDHYMGSLSLIREGRIGQIYKPRLDSAKSNDLNFEKILQRNRIPVNYYSQRAIKIGNSKVYLLNNSDGTISSESSNDASGVMKIVYGNNSILFTGDAGVKVEKNYISKYGLFLRSDVLKIAHHGSRTSSSIKFLESVAPRYALISAGVKNKFRHPSKEILARLKQLNVKILRTDSTGANLMVFDGYQVNEVKWRN